MRTIILGVLLLGMATTVQAEIVGKVIEYKDAGTTLEGYLVYDDAKDGKRPGVLVVHDWMGFGPYANGRAQQLAEMGYIAFAVDIYGKGVRPKNTDQASAEATKYKTDRELLRRRAKAGYEVLKAHALTDDNNIAAIGYCFGGTTVLEMARAGLDLKGAVSFHGGLDSLNPEDAKNIKAKLLVLHGADDPFVPAEDLAAFKKEMTDAGVDMRLVAYPGAVHSFTQKSADDDPFPGTAYNEDADRDSWQRMKEFFEEIFQ